MVSDPKEDSVKRQIFVEGIEIASNYFAEIWIWVLEKLGK